MTGLSVHRQPLGCTSGRVAQRESTGLTNRGSLVRTQPRPLASKLTAVTQIRNAYEHIEDRAMGTERGAHPDALTIFDYRDLLSNDRVSYGTYSLDLQAEVPALIAEARRFLKDVAADA